MDTSLYRDFTTSRGLKYHYFFSPAQASKPTILFCHGFPSTARDWRRLVPYFKDKGYGIIAPDMLGYGGTDKPTEPAKYVSSALAKDLVEILDNEGIQQVIAVGHDWGSRPVSRLANYYPERVLAYAWLAVAYSPPLPLIDFQQLLAISKQQVGYELFGYWLFFSEDDADKVMQEHIDSFLSVLWPHDPTYFRDRLAITGALKQSLLEDFRAPLPPYVSEEDKQEFIKTFREGGFQAPTCWYKVMTRGLAAQDDQQIPPERAYPPKSAPIFFGAALNDYVCVPSRNIAAFKNEKFKDHQVTIKEYDADHWLILSKADEIARDLEAWIEGFAPQQKANF